MNTHVFRTLAGISAAAALAAGTGRRHGSVYGAPKPIAASRATPRSDSA